MRWSGLLSRAKSLSDTLTITFTATNVTGAVTPVPAPVPTVPAPVALVLLVVGLFLLSRLRTGQNRHPDTPMLASAVVVEIRW
jgi:hypothetical protein